MHTTADDLLSRLQAATGPSRELDLAVHRHLQGKEFAYESWWTAQDAIKWRDGTVENIKLVPRYTESIDAALTLVPEGHEWLIEFFEGKYLAECDPPDHFNERVSAPAPAIALLIAIMRVPGFNPEAPEDNADVK